MTSLRSIFAILTISLGFAGVAAPSTFARTIEITNPEDGNIYVGEATLFIGGNLSYNYLLDNNPYYVHILVYSDTENIILRDMYAVGFEAQYGSGYFLGAAQNLQPGPARVKITATLVDYYFRKFTDSSSSDSVSVIFDPPVSGGW